MINRRGYIAESDVKPGCAVVQGSADNEVKAPGTDGEGDFIGIYSFEDNETKTPGEEIGIVLNGVVKAFAGGDVSAGKPAILKDDDSGSLVAVPAAAGEYRTVGIFLESGHAGEYVDFLVERGSVSV